MIKFLNPSSEKPYLKFKSAYQEALENDQKVIEAISVSSFNKAINEVDARYVNLKYIDHNKWIFFSNYNSPKARQFESHNQVSVLIYWASTNTQIRMKAKISKTSAEFSDQHFQGRTKEKNALAISSNQSQTIDSFEEVSRNFNKTLECMTPETNRPDFWGGYSFTPYYFEFWQGHENRLNKRHVFDKKGDEWIEQILQP
jgi:pyridoxamine 5'-phosphate oxidase